MWEFSGPMIIETNYDLNSLDDVPVENIENYIENRKKKEKEEAERKEKEKKKKPKFPFKKYFYLHSSKTSNVKKLEDYAMENDLIFDDDFLSSMAHALYEVKFELEIYEDGSYKILKVKDGDNILIPKE